MEKRIIAGIFVPDTKQKKKENKIVEWLKKHVLEKITLESEMNLDNVGDFGKIKKRY